jgi:hypothetical protein
MASFGARRRKTFSVRTQVIRGKRTRIGLVIPGIKRARRRTVSTVAAPIVAKPR